MIIIIIIIIIIITLIIIIIIIIMTYYTISTERWKFIVGFQAHFCMYFITENQDYFITTIIKANF